MIYKTKEFYAYKNFCAQRPLASVSSGQKGSLLGIGICECIPFAICLIAYFGLFGKLSPMAQKAILGSGSCVSGILLVVDSFLLATKKFDAQNFRMKAFSAYNTKNMKKNAKTLNTEDLVSLRKKSIDIDGTSYLQLLHSYGEEIKINGYDILMSIDLNNAYFYDNKMITPKKIEGFLTNVFLNLHSDGSYYLIRL